MDHSSNYTTILSRWVARVRDQMLNASDAIKIKAMNEFMSFERRPHGTETRIIGSDDPHQCKDGRRIFDLSLESNLKEFLDIFRDRILFTYRSDMQSLRSSDNERFHDQGWGCLIRVGQMGLAQCFMHFATKPPPLPPQTTNSPSPRESSTSQPRNEGSDKDSESRDRYSTTTPDGSDCSDSNAKEDDGIKTVAGDENSRIGCINDGMDQKRGRKRCAEPTPDSDFTSTAVKKRSLSELDVAVLNRFRDTRDAPFSIHKFVQYADENNLRQAKTQFGPTSLAITLDALVRNARLEQRDNLQSVVFDDAPIYLDKIKTVIKENTAEDGTSTCNGIIVFLALKLGINRFNMQYKHAIEACYKFPEFQGILGGGPTTSGYYFVGACSDYLYYLDPHTVQTAFISEVRFGDDNGQFFPAAFPNQLEWKSINPSMALVFTVDCREDSLEQLADKLNRLDCPALACHESPPKFREYESVEQDGFVFFEPANE